MVKVAGRQLARAAHDRIVGYDDCTRYQGTKELDYFRNDRTLLALGAAPEAICPQVCRTLVAPFSYPGGANPIRPSYSGGTVQIGFSKRLLEHRHHSTMRACGHYPLPAFSGRLRQ